jgi:hypothetical protein
MRARVIQGLFPGGRAAVQPQVAARALPVRHMAPRPATTPAAAAAIQRRGGAGGFAVDPGVLRTIGPGAPLPDALRSQMEQALGANFSDVRVHVGPQAQSIGAIAFTAGSDLYFAPGRFQPDTAAGRRLLGHELAHVVQQRQGRVRGGAGAVTVVQDAVLEAEAERAGVRASAVPRSGPAPAMYRHRPALPARVINMVPDWIIAGYGNVDPTYDFAARIGELTADEAGQLDTFADLIPKPSPNSKRRVALRRAAATRVRDEIDRLIAIAIVKFTNGFAAKHVRDVVEKTTAKVAGEARVPVPPYNTVVKHAWLVTRLRADAQGKVDGAHEVRLQAPIPFNGTVSIAQRKANAPLQMQAIEAGLYFFRISYTLSTVGSRRQIEANHLETDNG